MEAAGFVWVTRDAGDVTEVVERAGFAEAIVNGLVDVEGLLVKLAGFVWVAGAEGDVAEAFERVCFAEAVADVSLDGEELLVKLAGFVVVARVVGEGGEGSQHVCFTEAVADGSKDIEGLLEEITSFVWVVDDPDDCGEIGEGDSLLKLVTVSSGLGELRLEPGPLLIVRAWVAGHCDVLPSRPPGTVLGCRRQSGVAPEGALVSRAPRSWSSPGT